MTHCKDLKSRSVRGNGLEVRLEGHAQSGFDPVLGLQSRIHSISTKILVRADVKTSTNHEAD